ncbi:MAG TPA: DUF885 domain-containing protein [Saprospiraceae bacterium]|nr:DUF885 domain-containing protein [Saprospiraceae bacterium]HPN70267.1 DUF885 domain-containing protein [Saprospiraceae bacterium]
MIKKKRTWKFWIFRTLLVLFLIGAVWLINLIWFRPLNIRHFYDRTFVLFALKSPETVTQLGIPVLYDWTKDKWDDVSDAKLRENFKQTKKDYETLMSYDFDGQSPENQLNTKILRSFMKSAVDGEPFFYHDYPLNQLQGIQSGVPNLLTNSHQLEDKSDIKAYITRLKSIGIKFDQVLEGLRIREEKGIIPPKFVIKRVIDEMTGFIGGGVEKNVLYTNFTEKLGKIDGLSDEQKSEFTQQVADAITKAVIPAYQKLINYQEALYEKATTDDGVWKLPNGDAFYRHQLKISTTTDLSPEEVHQIGLKEVNRIEKEMWAILQNEGYTDTTKTIGFMVDSLSREERFLYPESDSGKTMLLAEYKRIIDEANAKLDKAFDIRPKASISVERVPEFQEKGEAKGRYTLPAMDGSRGGVFWANVRKVSEHPKFTMKTLAYHEGVPGHHFQLGIQTELKGLPIFRTVVPFTAYGEGWALYSEQLAYELGFYDNDPFGNLGRLQAEMFRACRLVVDTGIHSKKWTREQAIKYMVDYTGNSESEATTEIERYIVWPGQACAYKIGMMKILELRAKAKETLGVKFDLQAFHRVVLESGSVPLDVLEENIMAYLKQKK